MMKYLLSLSMLTISFFLFSCLKPTNEENRLTVVATPVPAGEILEFAMPMMQELGYELDLVIVSDYVLPNQFVSRGDADVNLFQHKPFLDRYNQENKDTLVVVDEIYLPPIGLYSKRLTSKTDLLSQVQDGDVILMSNSVSDQGRVLFLLQDAGLITLKEGVLVENATINDISSMAKQFTIKDTVSPELLMAMYRNDEAAIIAINANFAMDGGLSPMYDALFSESYLNSPYTNILVSRMDNQSEEKVLALARVLRSPSMQQFILDHYNGAIIPVTE